MDKLNFKTYLNKIKEANDGIGDEVLDLDPSEISKLRNLDNKQQAALLKKKRIDQIKATTDAQEKTLLSQKAALRDRIDRIDIQLEQLRKRKQQAKV